MSCCCVDDVVFVRSFVRWFIVFLFQVRALTPLIPVSSVLSRNPAHHFYSEPESWWVSSPRAGRARHTTRNRTIAMILSCISLPRLTSSVELAVFPCILQIKISAMKPFRLLLTNNVLPRQVQVHLNR